METLMELGTKIISIFEAIMGMDFVSEIIPMLIMWVIGGVLIYCAIVKDMEPTLLLPMGFGTILVNLPLAELVGVISEEVDRCSTITTGVELNGVDDRIEVCVNNLRLYSARYVDYIVTSSLRPLISEYIAVLVGVCVCVLKGGLKDGRKLSSELGCKTLLSRCVDCLLDTRNGTRIRLGDKKHYRILRVLTLTECLCLENVYEAETYLAGNYLCAVHLCHFTNSPFNN
jgi:hypothetical protein